MKSFLVVDCQYDFIDGSLACENAENAVRKIIEHINKNRVEVMYSMDWHTPENKSFKRNGGIWPDHCIQGERGAELHQDFEKLVGDKVNRPTDNNVYYKGIDDYVEEYSAYNAKTISGELLRDSLSKEVVVAGIASEFCVRETVMALAQEGFKVSVLEEGLGYVNHENHLKNLDDLKEMGVGIVGK